MRLLKFDTLYPATYLDKKISDSQEAVTKMKFNEFHNWLIKLRINYSDFYTYNLGFYGWDTKEFFLNNDLYLEKCGIYYFGYTYWFRKQFHRFRNLLSHISIPFTEVIIQKHISVTKPDVLFVREQVFVRSKFWERFRKDKLLVSRMDCGIPNDWSPLSFDIIYSNIPVYISFFKNIKITTLQNSNGFDKRISSEINQQSKKKIFDIVFVGGLGNYYGFEPRTRFFEELISKYGGTFNFGWWGYKTGDFDKLFPELTHTFMGITGGLEMFEIYSAATIVINDYGAGVGGMAENQRIYEVMGVGTLLLTKESETLQGWEDYLVTYSDVEDCYKKITYYLSHETEREEIAKAGQEFVLKNYNYQNLMEKVSAELKQAYHDKFFHKEKALSK